MDGHEHLATESLEQCGIVGFWDCFTE